MNVLIVNGSIAYDKLFSSLGYSIVHHVEDANLVCFTGGADVTPSLYGQDKHPKTYNSVDRDAVESIYYQEAREAGIPMVGICRGGQFLHVMNGGSLYQDVDGHAVGSAHKAVDILTGVSHAVTSTHHQMMSDTGVGSVVAIAHEATKLSYMSGGVELTDATDDVEVMWHADTKCLCFQPHPEFNWAIQGAETTYLYFKNLLERYYVTHF